MNFKSRPALPVSQPSTQFRAGSRRCVTETAIAAGVNPEPPRWPLIVQIPAVGPVRMAQRAPQFAAAAWFPVTCAPVGAWIMDPVLGHRIRHQSQLNGYEHQSKRRERLYPHGSPVLFQDQALIPPIDYTSMALVRLQMLS
ncbi:hypothetical protein G6M78_03135 [Agrobacterium tumefaciens]|uniref:hypothetical protein n=1 Tax=Agrobacterium tumefaciens TaxID=358 RepID=UPI0015720FEE|nr:hypothetical protein [Agrobacterium tumefaciens]NTE54066.1 hypothetical protein [Agrobacterium tumefaciens]NTE70231.1 hypothetical protein [Agrobacterium tumefaciens]